MVNEINESRVITQRSWYIYTYDQCWPSALHETRLCSLVARTLVSSCQQLRHGLAIMSTHVYLSQDPIKYIRCNFQLVFTCLVQF